MMTEESAILVMCTSLLGKMCILPQERHILCLLATNYISLRNSWGVRRPVPRDNRHCPCLHTCRPIDACAFAAPWCACGPPHHACARGFQAHRRHQVGVVLQATPDRKAARVAGLLDGSRRRQRPCSGAPFGRRCRQWFPRSRHRAKVCCWKSVRNASRQGRSTAERRATQAGAMGKTATPKERHECCLEMRYSLKEGSSRPFEASGIADQ